MIPGVGTRSANFSTAEWQSWSWSVWFWDPDSWILGNWTGAHSLSHCTGAVKCDFIHKIFRKSEKQVLSRWVKSITLASVAALFKNNLLSLSPVKEVKWSDFTSGYNQCMYIRNWCIPQKQIQNVTKHPLRNANRIHIACSVYKRSLYNYSMLTFLIYPNRKLEEVN